MRRNVENGKKEARSQKPEARMGMRLLLASGFWLLASLSFAADRPPVIDAARNGDRDGLRVLLQKGANANAAEADGSTALHWASYRDDVESAGLLIRAGAKINTANDLGVTPLWTASQNGSEVMVRRLLMPAPIRTPPCWPAKHPSWSPPARAMLQL